MPGEMPGLEPLGRRKVYRALRSRKSQRITKTLKGVPEALSAEAETGAWGLGQNCERCTFRSCKLTRNFVEVDGARSGNAFDPSSIGRKVEVRFEDLRFTEVPFKN